MLTIILGFVAKKFIGVDIHAGVATAQRGHVNSIRRFVTTQRSDVE